MGRLFILIKRKGAKRPLGVIPARKGISKSVLLKRAKQQIRPPLMVMKVISEMELKKSFKGRLVRKRKRVVKKKKR